MLLTYSFHMHFSNFGLPELNRTALANAATVSGHSHDIYIRKQSSIFPHKKIRPWPDFTMQNQYFPFASSFLAGSMPSSHH